MIHTIVDCILTAYGAYWMGDTIRDLFLARRQKAAEKAKSVIEDQAINYCVHQYHSGAVGYICPQCNMTITLVDKSCDAERIGLFKYCDCAEYIKGHFHFLCAGCGFKSVMRTAADKEKK